MTIVAKMNNVRATNANAKMDISEIVMVIVYLNQLVFVLAMTSVMLVVIAPIMILV